MHAATTVPAVQGARRRHGSEPGLRPRTRIVAATALALLCASLLPSSTLAQGGSPSPSATHRPVAVNCAPALEKLDPKNVHLTGVWKNSDGGAYYIRQIGQQIWWSGMSDRFQALGELGHDWNNVAMGTLKPDLTIDLQWADVPHGNSLGGGTVTLEVQADASGFIQLAKKDDTGSGFRGELWTPCRPEAQTATHFGQPFAVTPPTGVGLSYFDDLSQLATFAASSERNAYLQAWIMGPNWVATCSAPASARTLVPGAAGFLDYLRSVPDLSVTNEAQVSVDGRPATTVDITSALNAKGCEDGNIHLWKEGDLESTLGMLGTEKLVVMDVNGSTVVFEIWGAPLGPWLPDAQALLDSLRFLPAATSSPAP